MIFSSIWFAFFFLPIVLILYNVIPNRYRNLLLLIASLLFYGYGEPRFVFVMLLSIACNYVVALRMDAAKTSGARRNWMILAAAVNIGILFVFKYLDFALTITNDIFGSNLPMRHIALPIGISFFTFQELSYVLDVYRKDTPVQKDPFKLALYVSFFPQLIAGPIVRYNSIAEQIDNRTVTWERFGYGCRRFLGGFIKKVLVANTLSVAAEQTFSVSDFLSHPAGFFWIGSICYSLQILFDFSGYSDMAIGLGAMFGFTFEENFNDPYAASSITDFWRRWHISLSRWFRDYVYIPLGGSRVKLPKQIRNIFVVWLLTGIWHGANFTFIAWGLGYFVLLMVEKYVILPWKRGRFVRFLWRIFTLLMVNFEWVLFNAKSLKHGLRYILAMLGDSGQGAALADPAVLRILREQGPAMVLGILLATPIIGVLKKWFRKQKPGLVRHAAFGCGLAALLGLFLVAVSELIVGAHNPFIYFNF